MKGTSQFIITEWQWLKMQLQIHSLNTRSEMYSVYFKFEPAGKIKIICQIFAKHTKEMISQKQTKETQLEYYQGWVSLEKDNIDDILIELPTLKDELNIDDEVKFSIIESYGMGSFSVCDFIGNKIVWNDIG